MQVTVLVTTSSTHSTYQCYLETGSILVERVALSQPCSLVESWASSCPAILRVSIPSSLAPTASSACTFRGCSRCHSTNQVWKRTTMTARDVTWLQISGTFLVPKELVEGYILVSVRISLFKTIFSWGYIRAQTHDIFVSVARIVDWHSFLKCNTLVHFTYGPGQSSTCLLRIIIFIVVNLTKLRYLTNRKLRYTLVLPTKLSPTAADALRKRIKTHPVCGRMAVGRVRTQRH